eukprot:3559063-Pyramimonas_sp.AAC.2
MGLASPERPGRQRLTELPYRDAASTTSLRDGRAVGNNSPDKLARFLRQHMENRLEAAASNDLFQAAQAVGRTPITQQPDGASEEFDAPLH